eukprot:2860313-Amphidinium_carterae.1
MAKMQLQTSQNLRLVMSVVFETFVLKANSPEAEAMAEEGRKYGEQTRGKPGHALGPPHVWLFGALLKALQQRGDAVGAVNATAVKQLAERYALLTLGAKAELVKACRMQKTFDKECRRLLLALSPGVAEQQQLLAALAQTGAVHKLGRAPEGEMERSLQRAVESMP